MLSIRSNKVLNVQVNIEDQTVLDKSIEEVAKEAIPKISVLGVGGGGSNIISSIKKEIIGTRVIALNSDAQHLSITRADERILLGYNTTGGLGCGGFSEQGVIAAEESATAIERSISDSDLVFVTSTLGGGTGTGASPIVAKISKELGALTVGVIAIPFDVEGTRLDIAKEGLKKLVDVCDSVIVIDNNRLRKIAGNFPLKEAFGMANKLIAGFINNISDALAAPSLINLDFADMMAIMKGGDICAIGFGEGSGETKVEEAVEKALNSQLLDVGDIKNSEGALIHLEGGDDMTLEDINRAGELVTERISPAAKVIWGANVNSELQERLRTTIVLAKIDSPFLSEKTKKTIQIKPFKNIKKKKSSKKNRIKSVTKKDKKKSIKKSLSKPVKKKK